MKYIVLILIIAALTGCSSRQLAVIDRIDRVNQYAVLELEGATYYNVLLKDLPQGAKEGDVIIITKDGFYIDSKETAARKKEVTKLLNELYDYPEGDQ